ncbi:MAG: CpaF family protein [Planctomycetes bacterium]|nr:CpaF family protein [Planctomycetota bacterium]
MTATPASEALNAEHEFQRVKARIHEQLVESFDLSRVGKIDVKVLRNEVHGMAKAACDSRKELRGVDHERLVNELMDEIFGLGPLERLMADETVSDILVNGPGAVYVERNGRLEQTDIVFADDAHLLRIMQRIVAKLGRRIDESNPMVDARLADGSRVNAVIPPLSLEGPTLSIRRFGHHPLTIDDLLAKQSILPDMVKFLRAAVDARVSMLISGGTGAGKTTLLNVLSRFIPAEERIITIEDSAELILQHKHRVRMETRMPNTEGLGQVTQRDLVRNSLRMRPDRIVVGEVRGAEVWDMLQAMNTGHEGSLTTIHANTTRDALTRLEMMSAMTGFELPIDVVRQYIASGITLVVHASRLKGGPRRIMQVSEILGVRNGQFEIEDVCGFEQTGVDANGVAVGEFFFTGYQPKCLTRIQAAGGNLPAELFVKRRLAVGTPRSAGN